MNAHGGKQFFALFRFELHLNDDEFFHFPSMENSAASIELKNSGMKKRFLQG